MKVLRYRPSPAMIVALLALFVALGGVGVAANGGNFILGQSNNAAAQTALTATTNAAALAVTNSGTGPGLKLTVPSGKPPMIVNSPTKVASLNADQLDGFDSSGFWKTGGNAGTTPGTNFIGTSDNQALDLKVNGQRALRIGPNSTSPNLIGGWAGNSVNSGVFGAVIAGGGGSAGVNKVTNSFGTVGGGRVNTASGFASTVGGGEGNSASGADSTVAGGITNTASGSTSFAAGFRAKATQQGSFVWGDSTNADVTALGPNTFTVRASGGTFIQGSAKVESGALTTAFVAIPDLATTPSVSGGNLFETNNSAPTTITDFIDEDLGQTITIVFLDSNTTVQDNANLSLNGDFVSTPDDTLTLVAANGKWYEVSRSVN